MENNLREQIKSAETEAKMGTVDIKSKGFFDQVIHNLSECMITPEQARKRSLEADDLGRYIFSEIRRAADEGHFCCQVELSDDHRSNNILQAFLNMGYTVTYTRLAVGGIRATIGWNKAGAGASAIIPTK